MDLKWVLSRRVSSTGSACGFFWSSVPLAAAFVSCFLALPLLSPIGFRVSLVSSDPASSYLRIRTPNLFPSLPFPPTYLQSVSQYCGRIRERSFASAYSYIRTNCRSATDLCFLGTPCTGGHWSVWHVRAGWGTLTTPYWFLPPAVTDHQDPPGFRGFSTSYPVPLPHSLLQSPFPPSTPTNNHLSLSGCTLATVPIDAPISSSLHVDINFHCAHLDFLQAFRRLGIIYFVGKSCTGCNQRIAVLHQTCNDDTVLGLQIIVWFTAQCPRLQFQPLRWLRSRPPIQVIWVALYLQTRQVQPLLVLISCLHPMPRQGH